jgi:phytanoyl-CoA hydroxylase
VSPYVFGVGPRSKKQNAPPPIDANDADDANDANDANTALPRSPPKHNNKQKGFLAIPGFASPEEVAALRARANELVQSADLTAAASSIFSTVRQQKRVHAAAAAENSENENEDGDDDDKDSPASSDAHFLASAGAVSLFLEEKAVDRTTGAVTVPRESAVNKIGHALHDREPTFAAFSRSPSIAALLRSLGYARPLPVQSMYIFKGPQIGGEVSPHRDDSFLATDPRPSVTGLWLALEKATRDNGCLWAVPGSHRDGGGLPERRFVLREGGGDDDAGVGDDDAGEGGEKGGPGGEGKGGGGGDDGGKTAEGRRRNDKKKTLLAFTAPQPEHDLSRAVPIECGAGTLVVLHGHVLHYSGENTSAVSRHSYTAHYVEGGRGFSWRRDNWLQRPPERGGEGEEGFRALYDDDEEKKEGVRV